VSSGAAVMSSGAAVGASGAAVMSTGAAVVSSARQQSLPWRRQRGRRSFLGAVVGVCCVPGVLPTRPPRPA
jgi:hypothetical protein